MIKKISEHEFSHQELKYYARHFVLPEFGIEGQRRLKESRVLVVGAGGLGCPMLQYLAAAGVGHIGIVDGDVVDASNLHRQILFTVDDIGKPKVEAAKERLLKINPNIEIVTYNYHLSRENALDLVAQYDIIADGTDNFPTRYLVNDACILKNKPNVYASVFRYEGQVSVFNFNKNNERGVNYRDLFPTPPPAGLIPDCAEGGVLGVLPGIIGSMQASEVIKLASGVGEPLAGRLFIFDAVSFTTKVFKIPKNPEYQPVTELIDYEFFCGVSSLRRVGGEGAIPEISPEDLKILIKNKADFQLIDVREAPEYAVQNIGGELTPLSIFKENISKIAKNKQVVVHCQSGKRSAEAVRILLDLGFNNVFNLKGGLNAFN
jgi:adenylyltransferase/sulfurtransferase